LAAVIHAPAAVWELPSEIIEDSKQIAVQIRGGELVQIPGLRLRRGLNFRTASAPGTMQAIDFCFAIEVDPDHHRRYRALCAAKIGIGQEQPAVTSGNLPNSFGAPIPVEPETLLVVESRVSHVLNGHLRNSARKGFTHSVSPRQYDA